MQEAMSPASSELHDGDRLCSIDALNSQNRLSRDDKIIDGLREYFAVRTSKVYELTIRY